MLGPEPRERPGHERGAVRLGHPHDLTAHARRVGERSEQVHHGPDRELAADRAGVLHGGMERGREQKRDACLAQHPGCVGRVEADPHAQRLEHVGRTALGCERSVAVLRHDRTGARGDERGGGRDIEGGDRSSTGPAGVHEVCAVRLDPHHGVAQRAGGARHFLRGLAFHAQSHQQGRHLSRRRFAAHHGPEHFGRLALTQRPTVGEGGDRLLQRGGRGLGRHGARGSGVSGLPKLSRKIAFCQMPQRVACLD